MNKRILLTTILAVSVLLLSLAFAPLTQVADNVTLTVHDSSGDLLGGVNVYYNDYSNHWVLLGNTSKNAASIPKALVNNFFII